MTLKQAQLRGNPLQQYRSFRRNPIQFLQNTQSLGDLVQIPSMTGRASYILHHPELVKAVLALDEDKVVKGQSANILGYTLGKGLLTSESEEHARQRRQLQPAFHKDMLANSADEIVRLAEERITSWQSGEWFSVSNELLDLTLDVVFQTLFGAYVGSKRALLHQVVEESVEFSAKKLLNAFPAPFWLPTPANLTHRQTLESFDAIIAELMQSTLPRSMDTEGKTRNDGRDADIEPKAVLTQKTTVLKFLHDVRTESGEPLSPVEIRNQLATLIIGGHETTANLLTWVIYELARHPDVLTTAADEVDSVLQGHRPSFEDVRRLPFLRQILRETMRMYPPAWTILRESIAPIEVENILIPPQSSLIISPYVLHRNPEYFPHPESFSPARFDNHAAHTWPQFAYIPFGGGSRTCIGNTFAQMEATLILAVLLQQDVSWSTLPNALAQPEPSVSLRVKGGLDIMLMPRSNTSAKPPTIPV